MSAQIVVNIVKIVARNKTIQRIIKEAAKKSGKYKDIVVDKIKFIFPWAFPSGIEVIKDSCEEFAEIIIQYAGNAIFAVAYVSGKLVIEFSKEAYLDLIKRVNSEKNTIINDAINKASKEFEQTLLINCEERDEKEYELLKSILMDNEVNLTDKKHATEKYIHYIGKTLFELQGCIIGLTEKNLDPSELLIQRYMNFELGYQVISNANEKSVHNEEITKEFAWEELLRINDKVQTMDRASAFIFLDNSGLPIDAIIKLQRLWNERTIISGEKIHTGKIILYLITKFLKQHKFAIVGVAGGVILALCIGYIVAQIPILGSILETIAKICSLWFAEKIAKYDNSDHSKLGSALYYFLKDFLKTIKAIFTLLKDDFMTAQKIKKSNKLETLCIDIEANRV